MIKKNKGIALIAAIMLIVFISIVVLGLSVFIGQWYKQIDIEQIEARCIYNAMAGVNYAIWNYNSNPSVLVNGTIPIDANNNFTVSTVAAGGGGGDSSSLVVDATGAALGNNNRRLIGLHIRNSSASAVTIDRMIVTWSISNRTMSQIQINGFAVWFGSANSSPANINITNTMIPGNTTRNIDLIQFNSNMSNATITLSFVMTDGTTTSACTVWPRQSSLCTQVAASLTIESMGKTTGSNQYRSVQASYNITTGNVSSYDEIFQTVP